MKRVGTAVRTEVGLGVRAEPGGHTTYGIICRHGKGVITGSGSAPGVPIKHPVQCYHAVLLYLLNIVSYLLENPHERYGTS